jgi:hypothetical protein
MSTCRAGAGRPSPPAPRRDRLAQADHQPALGLHVRRTAVWRSGAALPATTRSGCAAAPCGNSRGTVSTLWLSTSGRGVHHDSAAASISPRKSGMSTSTVQPGRSGAHLADDLGEEAAAPPSGRSSRVTEVIDGVAQPQGPRRLRHATRLVGVGWAGPAGLVTLQKRQARVQTSPRMRNVAVRRVPAVAQVGAVAPPRRRCAAFCARISRFSSSDAVARAPRHAQPLGGRRWRGCLTLVEPISLRKLPRGRRPGPW